VPLHAPTDEVCILMTERVVKMNQMAAILKAKTAVTALGVKEALALQEDVRGEIRVLKQKIQEEQDAEKYLKIQWKQQVEEGEKLLQHWTMWMRKMQLTHEHEALIHRDRVNTNSTDRGNALVDVKKSMRRTKEVMSAEIERVAQVNRRMDEGKQSLKHTHDQYTQVEAELSRTRKLLFELEKQAYMDKLWILAGMIIFACTVILVILERVPRSFIPFL